MTLKELRDSLNNRFDSSFDDTSVIFQYTDANGKTSYDLVCFVGCTTNLDTVIIGGYNEALKLQKKI